MEKKKKIAFGKRNFQLMLLGIAVLVTGFVIMSLDKEPHGFGFMGITLGPIVVMTGFIIEFFAILHLFHQGIPRMPAHRSARPSLGAPGSRRRPAPARCAWSGHGEPVPAPGGGAPGRGRRSPR